MSKKKPTLFIGSSTESRKFAESAKETLSKHAECILWTDGEKYKKINEFFLNDLIRLTSNVDFALMIFGKDDKVESRGKIFHVARDNVLLEYGMFLSRLGIKRTFGILCDPESKVASDLQSLNLPCIAGTISDEELHEAVEKACSGVIATIAEKGFLAPTRNPSTAAELQRKITSEIDRLKKKNGRIVIKNVALDMEATWPFIRDTIIPKYTGTRIVWKSIMADYKSKKMTSYWSETVDKKTAKDSEEKMRAHEFSNKKIFLCKTYPFPPLIHGFLLNDEVAFLSICDLKNGKLLGSPNPYITIRRTQNGSLDKTSEHLISAFSSWFQHNWDSKYSRAIVE